VKEPYTPTHEIAYCMGLIVGEGSFISDSVPTLVVGLQVADPQPLLDLQSVFGGTIYGPYIHNGRHFRRWVLRAWQLEEALPYLERWLPPSRKREQYEAWRERWAAYFTRVGEFPPRRRWTMTFPGGTEPCSP